MDYDDLLFHEEKKRRTILVGEVQKEYGVKNLLDGIEPPEKRQRQPRGAKLGEAVHIQNYVDGDQYMSETYNANNIQNSTITQGKNINQVTAEKIENSFNLAEGATNKSDDIRDLLKQLAAEMAKIAEKPPNEKAEEAATDLESMAEHSTKDKPVQKYWELSKKGVIEAAEAVGVIGETAIKLVGKLGTLLGF